MGINIGDTINSFSDSLIETNTVNYILNNPIYASAIIAIFSMLIIVYIFLDEDIEDFTTLTLRAMIYIFISTLGVLFLYNKKMKKDMKENYSNDNISRVLDTINGGEDAINDKTVFNDNEIVPVNIRTNFDNDDFIEENVLADNTDVTDIVIEKNLLTKCSEKQKTKKTK
jgi:hypothetical protein